MNKNNTKLICKAIWYYSILDETSFFNWVGKIEAIVDIDAVGDELYLYVANLPIQDDDLREIIALFYRYKIDMKQLRIFLNDSNKAWFFDRPKGYWHKKIFG